MSTSAVDQVLAAAGIQFAYLFGSRATGRHRPASDADIAIMPGGPLDLLTEAGLAESLLRSAPAASTSIFSRPSGPTATSSCAG